MARVLMTGFAPFGGESVNPSWQAVSLVAARRDDVAAVELPCAFATSLPTLRRALAEHRPSLVVCAGQAGGRAEVTPERVAINLNDARIPDNLGEQPIDTAVVVDGPAAYFSTLPIKAMVKAVREAGVAASVSQTAGTFVCNQVFYRLQHSLAGTGVRSGFIHVPYLPEQVVVSGQPSMALTTLVKGLQVAVLTAWQTSVDVTEAGGQVS